jgi:hypothetical protein
VDKLAEFLTSDRLQPSVAPEVLELLGKQAAAAYLEHGTPPTRTIVKLASEGNRYTAEHIKRICELANQSIYLGIHDKNKVASAGSSYPQFPLADPTQVVQQLTVAAKPVVEGSVDPSYGSLPNEKKASINDEQLAELFGQPTQIDFSSETVATDITALKDSMRGLKDNLTHLADQHDNVAKYASEKYYDEVKRHMLDGGSIADVVNAAQTTGLSAEKVATVINPVVTRLMQEKVAGAHTLKHQLKSLEKLAHRQVNPEHPFVALVSEIADANDTIAMCSVKIAEANEAIHDIDEFIKGNLRALASR